MSQKLTAAPLVRVAQAALVLAAFAAWPAPAFASTTIGADLTGTPNTSNACGGMTGLCDVATLSESGVAEVSPIDGVVVRWRVKDSSGPLALRVVRPTAGYLFVSTSAIAIPSDTTGVDTFNTRQPIKAGDIVAVELESATATIGLDGTGNAPTGTRLTAWPGPVPDGLALPPAGSVDQTRAYVNRRHRTRRRPRRVR
jgi:hypothetical protein